MSLNDQLYERDAEAAKNDTVNHTGETRDKVKLLHGQGMSAKEIAAQLNITDVSVYCHLRKLNGTFKPRAKKEDAPAVAAPVTTLRESKAGRLPAWLSPMSPAGGDIR
jgi:transposase